MITRRFSSSPIEQTLSTPVDIRGAEFTFEGLEVPEEMEAPA